jgi:hypothetical protein
VQKHCVFSDLGNKTPQVLHVVFAFSIQNQRFFQDHMYIFTDMQRGILLADCGWLAAWMGWAGLGWAGQGGMYHFCKSGTCPHAQPSQAQPSPAQPSQSNQPSPCENHVFSVSFWSEPCKNIVFSVIWARTHYKYYMFFIFSHNSSPLV